MKKGVMMQGFEWYLPPSPHLWKILRINAFKLKNAGISIEYMYAFIGKSDKGALVIVRVENPEKALEVLKDENVTVVSPEEVYRM